PDDGNLDRIQIVKGWTKDGELFEHVYDVAWAGDRRPDAKPGKVPAVKSTVDIKNASYTNTVGAVELKKVWRDPEFDPALHAFYYVRVLQIPTPRRSGPRPPRLRPTTGPPRRRPSHRSGNADGCVAAERSLVLGVQGARPP